MFLATNTTFCFESCKPEENDRIRVTEDFMTDDKDDKKQLYVNDILVVKRTDKDGDITVNKETNPWEKNSWILRKNFRKLEVLDVILLFFWF